MPTPSDFPKGIFFKDAFKEGLIGERPVVLGGSTQLANQAASSSGSSHATSSTNTAGSRWSEIVSARTLEDEIKSLQRAVQQSVTTPGRFNGGGYRDVRRQFTEVATLFAVITEYDGRVRWKEMAPLARDLFARAAANAKVTSTAAFNQAKQRKLDLEDLVRGGTLTSGKQPDRENDWSVICDRGPLMQRFTVSFDEGLMIWTSNESEFTKNSANIIREAELLKLFAEVLQREGMEDAGDEEYDNYSRQLTKACDAVLQAVRDKDPKAARAAVSMVGKSCTQCHDDYRG